MIAHKYLIGVSVMLFGSGVALTVPLGLSRFEQQKAISAAQSVRVATPPQAQAPSVISGTPRHIDAPSVGISLPVADGNYDPSTGNWTLSDDGAFFATPTSPANSDNGNTFIYGHAVQKIFGRLPRLTIGADVTITTDNGYAFTYTYVKSEIVDPTNVNLFAYQGKPRLTLQTCSGVWSENRQLFYFNLKEYHKL